MSNKKPVKTSSRYYPPELMPFVWCTACLGVVLEQSDEANDIFEDIIDCLDLPGCKELTEKVENELPGSESLMKQIVKESGYDFHKPPSKENMGIPFMRGLMKGGLRFVSGYRGKYVRWALKGKRRIKDYKILISKIDDLVKVGFNSKNEREKGKYKVKLDGSDQLIWAIFALAYSVRNEMQLSQLENAKVIRSTKKLFSINDVVNRTMTAKMNRVASREFRKSGFSLKQEATIENTAFRWYQSRVVYSGPEEYCRKMELDGEIIDPANINNEIRACDEAVGYTRRNTKRKNETREKKTTLMKLKMIIRKTFKQR